MATDASDRCPSCHAERPADAPQGLCPRCLFRAGLDSEVSSLCGTEDIEETVDLAIPASVLETITESVDGVPRVQLRDTEPLTDHPGSPEMPAPEDRLGRLRLLGEVARGGMGAILKGRDEDLGRELAVKVLLERHRDNPTLVRRFIEEAQIGGQLQHPGIVPIYELGTFSDRRPYFAMKLVKGQTLAVLMAERASPSNDLPRLLSVFQQVCLTIAYAHSRGVIHRDLKPSNIMVGSFGEVQVMDWGLAKVLSREGAIHDDPRPSGYVEQEVIPLDDRKTVVATSWKEDDSELSHLGSVMGTLSYMAPEQARGEVDMLDERADVFALGSILCEILTGSPAFLGDSAAQIHRKSVEGDLENANSRLDACGAEADLVSLARDCLAADPEGRPRDAQVVAERLGTYLDGVQESLRTAELARATESARAEEALRTARAERWGRRLTAALASAVISLMGLGAGYGWILHQRSERQAVVDSAVKKAMDEADRLAREASQGAGDPVTWGEALAAAQHAQSLLEPGQADPEWIHKVALRVQALSAERDAAQAERRLLTELEIVRGRRVDRDNPRQTDSEYLETFRSAGLDFETASPAQAGAWIARRTNRVELAASLDDWAYVRHRTGRPESEWRMLVETATLADSDPWRNDLRARIGSKDQEAADSLCHLADQQEALDHQPAASLVLLALRLANDLGDHERATAVLRRAWWRYPQDFWINFELSQAQGDDSTDDRRFVRPEEAIRYLSVAIAIRPRSSMAYLNLGYALVDQGDLHAALAAYTEAARLDPSNFWALNQCGYIRRSLGDMEGAVQDSRKAIEVKPDYVGAHLNMGIALGNLDRLDEAIAEFREAVRLDPNNSVAKSLLQGTLKRKQTTASSQN